MTTIQTAPKAPAAQTAAGLNIERIRADFPILKRQVNGKPLVYLDNAASSQMPQQVIDSLVRYQTSQHANINRAVHTLSEIATNEFEAARRKLQHFINAHEEREVIFTSGTTDAINLVMHGYGRKFIGPGDEIILTTLEHHSNIVPWQMLAEEKGATIRVVPVNDAGELLIDEYEKLFNQRTKFVGVTHVSNALGTINPIKQMIAFAHSRGVPVLVDGAQATPHMQVDVQDLDCDFYAFSGHKMCGPTGIGILFGKAALLESMQPFKGGGDMILSVTFEKTTYNTIPHKFEAGTPPIAAAIGLGAAVDYLSVIGMDVIAAYELDLLNYATVQMDRLPGVRIIGTSHHKAAVLSFVVEDVHPHDIGTLLNLEGIAVRTGHHCAQPVMQRFKVPATSRASFAFYNTMAEVDALIVGIRAVQKVFL
ncbi:MAG: cysteine desulfurase/selenocysteine lyase [Candidatus Azotimanducaceae bacterium]|jgi:cysteine desulfurase/selenocysteine lyase